MHFVIHLGTIARFQELLRNTVDNSLRRPWVLKGLRDCPIELILRPKAPFPSLYAPKVEVGEMNQEWLQVMNLYWIAGLAILVAVEKLAPMGNRISQIVGIVLSGWGLVVLANVLF